MVDTAINYPQVSSLHVKQFRCFEERTFAFTAPIVLIEGGNGTGKTSLVEALHFACYVKSFRAPTPRDLISHEKTGFFVRIVTTHEHVENSIQAGFSGSRRLVKINDQPVSSYKQLVDHYRVITITEDELGIIKEGPAVRRQFIDQALALQNPTISEYFKKALALTDQRSHALHMGTCTPALYEAWTEMIWDYTKNITLLRMRYLVHLEEAIQALLLRKEIFNENTLTIRLQYKPKKNSICDSYQEFVEHNKQLQNEEIRLRRNLFGFQLDDIEIQLLEKNARQYASRGQQKYVLLLLKAAQIATLPASQGPTLVILDDFITDLDEQRTVQLLRLFMSFGTQLILTMPRKDAVIHKTLSQSGFPYQIIMLDSCQ